MDDKIGVEQIEAKLNWVWWMVLGVFTWSAVFSFLLLDNWLAAGAFMSTAMCWWLYGRATMRSYDLLCAMNNLDAISKVLRELKDYAKDKEETK